VSCAAPREKPEADANDTTSGRSWGFMALLCVGGVCIVAALVLGNPATKVLVPFLALATLNGYRVGGLKVTAGLLGLVVGALLAIPAGQVCEGAVGWLFGLSGLAGRLASIVAVGIVLAVVVTFLVDRFIGRRLRRKSAVLRYDKWVGSGLGMAQGALIALVLLWSILILEPVASARLAMASEDRSAPESDPAAVRIVSLVEMARASFVGRIADAVNPMAESQMVTLPRKGLSMLSNPVAIEAFNNHPAIQRLSERRVVKEVVEVLAEDPEISGILASDEGLTQRDLLVVLSSPRLLEVLDRADVLTELRPIADELEEALDQALAQAAVRESPHGDE